MTTLWHVPENAAGKNPYGQLLTRSLEARGVRVIPIPHGHLFALRALRDRPDAVHFQFIDVFILPALSRSWFRAAVKGPLFLAQVIGLRLAGCRVVWTVHDLVNHERHMVRAERFFSLLFTRLVHGFVVHGEAARDGLVSTYRLGGRRRRRITVIAHPNFADAYPDTVTREQARETLAIVPDAFVILSLGQIRPYKGLPDLVRAFQRAGLPGRAELWIAGEAVDRTLAAELRRAADATEGVHVVERFLSTDEVATLLAACDVVALPYRRILTSGAAVLAMSFGKPCVAPRLGCLEEVLDEKGAFLYDASQPHALAEALSQAVLSSAALSTMGEHNRARATAWTWAKAAEALIQLYRSPQGGR